MKIVLPTDFKDITLHQYQQWHKGLDKFNSIALFTDIDLSKVSLNAINTSYEHLEELFSNEEPRFFKIIEHQEEKYGFVNDWDAFSAGEWIDVETYSSDPVLNAHKIMSILYRPIDRMVLDRYSIVPYEGTNDSLKDIPACFFLGAMVFFCESEKEYLNNLAHSLTEVAVQTLSRNAGDGTT